MKNYGLTYLAGMLCIFLAERMLSAEGSGRIAFDLIGAGLLVYTVSLCQKEHNPQNKAFSLPTAFAGVGILSLLVYALGTDAVIDRIGLDDNGEHTFKVAVSSIWPIIWLSGTLPFLALNVLIQKGQKHVSHKRAKNHAMQWLGFAFAISAIFPINYVAHETNVRWNVSYFKTALPGSSTQNIVANLSSPITAHLFFPTSSDVREEIRSYFDLLQDENLHVKYVDHAFEPELAKELKVRNNGYIALSVGEGEEKQTKTINIGKDFDSAKRKLKKLDSLVREKILKLSKGPQTIYVTTGHGEFYWKTDEERDQFERISTLKKLLKSSNFSIKELSLANGLGTAVPEDASIVLILGPTRDFFEAEIDVLNQYREAGGSMLISLEPGGVALDELLKPLGMRFDSNAKLSNATRFIPLTKAPTDQQNLVTIKYSTHASVSNLSKLSKTLPAYFLGAGALYKEAESKASNTVRSMEDTWNDLNGNFQYDKENENKQVWDIGLAVSETVEDKEARTIVMADTTWLSDVVLVQSQGNRLLLNDTLVWLLNDNSSAGEVNDEQDVKVIHSNENQGFIFYGTILLVPLGLFVLGAAYVRSRQKKGEK